VRRPAVGQTADPNPSRNAGNLYIAFDLSATKWQLAISDGVAKPSDIVVDRATVQSAKEALVAQIRAAKQRFGLDPGCPVHAVYEAGRDGYWIARWLGQLGVNCLIVDPASIAVDRKAKHAKTDALDARKLLILLCDHLNGRAGLRVLQPPGATDEDARELHRLAQRLQKNRGQLALRVQSLLFAQGIDRAYHIGLAQEIGDLRTGDGRALGPTLHMEIAVLCRQIAALDTELDALDAKRAQALAAPTTATERVASQLENLVGIGPIGAWMLAHELFGWRQFKNGKHLASFLGLTPTPFASGAMTREQGISKAGPGPLRALMIQLAWSWLRYQPQSPLAQWFNERWAKGGKRSRRLGIVALARKLVILLWRHATTGEVPDGVEFKPGDRKLKVCYRQPRPEASPRRRSPVRQPRQTA